VPDRAGHDARYAMTCDKLKALGWKQAYPFEQGFAATVQWYVENEAWWRTIKSGEYLDYYKRQYAERLALGE
jgi:dTDP-glucose 4,6-dehydratase